MSQVTVLAKLHDDDEHAAVFTALVKEGVLVGDDVRVVQLSEKLSLNLVNIVVAYLKVSALSLFVLQLAEYDLLGDVICVVALGRISDFDEKTFPE